MPTQKLSRLFFTIFFSIILLANHTILVFSQTPQLVPTDTVKAEKVIEPVQLSNIGIETEKTLSILRDQRNIIKPTDTEIAIDSLIPVRLERINELKDQLNLEEIEQMKLRQTENLKNDFVQYQVQFGGWRQTYSEKTEEIKKLQEELSSLNTKWKKTLEVERTVELPKEVTDRIKTNLNEISDLIKTITDRNNELLTKQTQLTDALLFIDEVLNVISKSERSYKDQLFTIDSPPFWHMFSEREDSTAFSMRFDRLIARHKEDLGAFETNYSTSIYWHAIFFGILLLITYYLRSDVAKWSDEKKDEAIGYSLYMIRHPISVGLLVCLLAAGLFYPEAPADVLNYFYVVLVIPILRLVPGLIRSLDKKYFYYIAGVFLLSQIAQYFTELIIIDRLLLLIIDISTILILLQLIKNRKSIASKNTRVNWKFAFSVLKLAAIILAISSFANIVGNTFFAKVLSRGTLTMVYGGIIIYASALVLRGLFSLILQQNFVSRLNMVQNYEEEVKKHVFRWIRFSAIAYWLYLTLDSYLVFNPIYDGLSIFLTEQWIIGSVEISIGSILAFFITLWIALTFSKLIRFILQDEILTHFEMPRGVPGAISMIVRLVLITIGFILAFGAAEIDMSNIAIIFGALGVGIGFGLQNIFNNLVSGLILAFERPIQVGDIIQISTLNLMGEVKEIGIRASIVRTFDGAEVVVPNGNLISNEMINWTLSDNRRRQEIIVGVAYGTDTNKVLEILNVLISDHENILKNPAPLVIFLGFGESSLDFRVLFWTHFDEGLSTKSKVGMEIDEAFKKAGIEIPFPQRDLHLRSISDAVDLHSKQSRPRSAAKGTKSPGRKKKSE
jgi:small-conductance mechanosensitive channel